MLDARELKIRRKYLGASEVPAVVGVDPYKTAADIWLSKVEQVDSPGSAATRAGTFLEPAILDWAAHELGVPESKQQRQAKKSRGIHRASLDLKIIGSPEAIEAKLIRSPAEMASLGEPGTDQLPDRVIVQAQSQIFVWGLQRVHVAVLNGRAEFGLYVVQRSEALIAQLVSRAEAFWSGYVIARKRPESVSPSMDMLKLIRRVPRKVASVPAQLILDAYRAREAAAEAAKEKRRALERLVFAIGDAEAAACQGRVYFRFAEVHRSGYTVQPTSYRKPVFTRETQALLENQNVKAKLPAAKTADRRKLACSPRKQRADARDQRPARQPVVRKRGKARAAASVQPRAVRQNRPGRNQQNAASTKMHSSKPDAIHHRGR